MTDSSSATTNRVLTARPTLYNGVQMRSRLEAAFAQYLDEHGFPWSYEGTAYASPRGQYVPDFSTIDPDNGQVTFWEVKPEGHGTAAVLERMRVILASKPDAHLLVVEGSWANGCYDFIVTQKWPQLVPYGVFIVPGCDSWHYLPPADDEARQALRYEAHEAAAELAGALELGWNERTPKFYLAPAECSGEGNLLIWAVAFHKGDALLVSRYRLPWLNAIEVPALHCTGATVYREVRSAP